MKPAAIADYLDHLACIPDTISPRREMSPFRPRSLQAVQSAESRSPLALHVDNETGAVRPPADEQAPCARDRASAAAQASLRESLAAREAAKAEEMALRLAEAHALGREEGLAQGRAEAQDLLASERVAAQSQAVMERLEFELNEYAQLEAAIRAGFAQVEENVGAAVARILTPFLAREAVRYVADELCRTISRLCAGGSPGLVTIRGPERVLRLLKDRVAALAADVGYVEDNGVEVVVETNACQIVTQLRPWADLLASLDF